MIARTLHIASLVVVVLMGVPPWLEINAIPNANQRSLAVGLFTLAALVGVWAAVRREPLALRATTIGYGAAFLGLGLFVTDRPQSDLLAYVTGLIGMNVLLSHDRAYGPILAAFGEDDAVARRTSWVVLRSLAIFGGVLAFTYGASLAILPLFAIDVGSQDPVVALGLAVALVLVILLLARGPDLLTSRQRARRAP